jgi:hypothetical protein
MIKENFYYFSDKHPIKGATNIDCNIKPNGLNNSDKVGCEGAVWGSGTPSEKYCNGNGQKGVGGTIQEPGKYPWFNKCCSWDDPNEKCIDKEGVITPKCKNWCAKNSEEWSTKCGWDNCNGCDACLEEDGVGTTTGEGTNNVLDADFQELEEYYNEDTNENIRLFDHLKSIRLTKEQNEYQLKKNRNNINEITDTRETNKRLVEIKLNKDRKTEFIFKVLKVCIIIIGCLIIIPILVKLNILSKTTGLGIFAICVIVIILVILYVVSIKNYNRDANDFNKFNFNNPNSKEIARSKLNVDLSESDQARCQAFSEIEADYNPDTIDSTLFDKYITKTDATTSVSTCRKND